MKAAKRTTSLYIRVSPEFLELINLMCNAQHSISDIIHECVADRARVGYYPKVMALSMEDRNNKCNLVCETDNISIIKRKNKIRVKALQEQLK